jgi:hypothetical protein
MMPWRVPQTTANSLGHRYRRLVVLTKLVASVTITRELKEETARQSAKEFVLDSFVLFGRRLASGFGMTVWQPVQVSRYRIRPKSGYGFILYSPEDHPIDRHRS